MQFNVEYVFEINIDQCNGWKGTNNLFLLLSLIEAVCHKLLKYPLNFTLDSAAINSLLLGHCGPFDTSQCVVNASHTLASNDSLCTGPVDLLIHERFG